MILTIFDDFLKGREGDRSQDMDIYTFLVDLGVLSPFSQESRLVSRPSGSQIQNYGGPKSRLEHFLLIDSFSQLFSTALLRHFAAFRRIKAIN